MRSLSAPVLSQLAARQGLCARLLVWIRARDRATGDVVTLGLWSGDDHLTVTIGGEARSYYGAGTLLSMAPLVSEVGLKLRSQRMTLSPLAPEVAQVLRGYDPRLAPVEVHVGYFEPQTGGLLAEPVRVFLGVINTVEITTPEAGGEAVVEVEMLSAAHALTRRLALKKSSETLRLRQPEDAFRQYIAVTGEVEAVWGEVRAGQPDPTKSTPPKPMEWSNR